MTKQTFNEAENFLLGSWEEARTFEDAMDSVRLKYKSVAQRIIDDAKEARFSFNSSVEYVSRKNLNGNVAMGFARREWAAKDPKWPEGLWIGGITLDELSSSPEEPAWAIVAQTNKKLAERYSQK